MIVNNLFRNEAFTSRLSALNYSDNGEYYLVELIAPKRRKSDFSLMLDDNVLTIEVKRNEESVNYLYSEWYFSDTKRSVRLPKDANKKAIKAKYKGGVLSVIIPKDEAKKPKMIEVV